jgi:hypothetical protein
MILAVKQDNCTGIIDESKIGSITNATQRNLIDERRVAVVLGLTTGHLRLLREELGLKLKTVERLQSGDSFRMGSSTC